MGMMRLLQLALLVSLLAMPARAAQDSEDALHKRFPESDAAAVQSAAKWLLDNFGAATAEDLNGVSNFAVDATSLASGDKSLSPDAKKLLLGLFKVEGDKAAVDAQSPEKDRRLASSSAPPTTTMKATTTKGAETTGGAITAQHLATSVAGILFLQMLSGM